MKKLLYMLSIILICIYPGIVLYTQNVYESNFVDIIQISLLFIVFGLILYGIIFIISKKYYFSIIMTNLIMFFVLHYNLLYRMLGEKKWMHIIICISFCVLLVIVSIVLKKIQDEHQTTIVGIIILTFSVLLIMDYVIAIPKIVNKYKILSERNDTYNSKEYVSSENVSGTNIYYVLLDEYGGQENLKEYYDYDNQSFYDSMLERKFNVSYSSRNEEGFSTVTIVPNLLNLDYVSEETMPEVERVQKFKNPYIYSFMKDKGYDVNVFSYPDMLDTEGSKYSHGGESFYEDKAGYFVLNNTAFVYIYNFWREQQKESETAPLSYGEELVQIMDEFTDLSDTIRWKQNNFSIGYFQTPHCPFFYDENGEEVNGDKYYEWIDKNYYLDYLKWTNKKIYEMVDKIIENDPQSIIIIQSDHGSRLVRHIDEVTGEGWDDESDVYCEKNVLNCVYFKGQKLDIEGLSGINTLRKVLNEEFGTEYEMINYKEN